MKIVISEFSIFPTPDPHGTNTFRDKKKIATIVIVGDALFVLGSRTLRQYNSLVRRGPRFLLPPGHKDTGLHGSRIDIREKLPDLFHFATSPSQVMSIAGPRLPG